MKTELELRDNVKNLFEGYKNATGAEKQQYLNQIETTMDQLGIQNLHDLYKSEKQERQMAERLKKKLITVVQQDMKSKTQLAMNVATGGLQIFGGCVLGASLKFGPACEVLGKTIGGFAEGGRSFTQAHQSFNQAAVTGSQFNSDNAKHQEEMIKEGASHLQQQRERLQRAQENAEQARHNSMSSVTNN